MDTVLKKTVASLETALKYNPENVELMTSLAEGYVRMGRFDSATIALCEKVLDKYPDNPLLLQAQAISYVIEQTNALDASLDKGADPPPQDAIESSIAILDDFLATAKDCEPVWFAWTRLNVLAGRFEAAAKGIQRLEELKSSGVENLVHVLDWVARKQDPERVDWNALYETYGKIGDERLGFKALERAFDKGSAKDKIGPLLLDHYLKKFDIAHPEDVSESVRPRFFKLLVDHRDTHQTGEWLRRATTFGWQVAAYSKTYIQSLMEDEQFDAAFEILQKMPMDAEVKELLNDLAGQYEKRDNVEQAVKILQFINSHELGDHELRHNQEIELNRNTELSLAELALKNGRLSEALAKFISSLCLHERPDPAVIERIENLLEQGINCEPATLLRLAVYFRSHKDFRRSILCLTRLVGQIPADSPDMNNLESLFDEALDTHPEYPEFRLQRGMLRRKMGKLDEAIHDFKIASADPDLLDRANRFLAQTHREMGQYREALARFQNMRLDVDDLESLYQLHFDFTQSDDSRSALTALQLITQIQPDYKDVPQLLANLTHGPVAPSSGGAPGSATPDQKMRDLIGDLATGRYRFVDKIGSGGMGVVYKVFDIRQNKPVAMKILRDGLAASSKALDRFFREARIAAQIRHRNIIDIYDYNISSQDGQNYIVMEYVEGQSLREFIDRHFDDTISTSMDYIAEQLYYGVQLFDALQATHDKGIIHRDIKPDNIMVTSKGEVRITDFGIVHVEEATFTPTGAMLGTPRYMAPEQVTGGKVDGRSDIYSVGILLYEVLTGSPPFMTGDISYQQVNKPPVEPRLLNSVIPQSVNNFILKCLEKKPDNRFPDAKTAKNVIAEILQSLGGCKKYENVTPSGTEEPAPNRATPRMETRPAKRSTPQTKDASVSPSAEVDELEMGDLDLDLPDKAG